MKKIEGAGGSPGGLGQFFIGFIMMCSGFYMLLNAISVNYRFGMGSSIHGFRSFGHQWNITGGMVLVPFIFGIGLIFYNGRNILGWLLSIGSISALIFGVISNINFTFKQMTAFDLIVILILAIGGLGLLLKSLKGIDLSGTE